MIWLYHILRLCIMFLNTLVVQYCCTLFTVGMCIECIFVCVGAEARGVLMQTGLSQPTLAQIWSVK